ncbi:hypothetical protein LEN26_006914 [Aphanomyces euteiches]|nr:hypothetical protein AeMF1_001958 [Aphanomyces euteiches]KAH9133972.1 hypothetical protein LEN26_006914 [Aphanomyces euteiches]KAH9189683.1 hypothetical protein AeNC1_008341 [Aphanomyces euteiches]
MGRSSSGGGGGDESSFLEKAPHVYYIESGFLAVGNLLRPEQWVKDENRRHCNICMQQFHAFRRRHHCRTCGEVLCNSCSKHKKIRLVELNFDLTVRICTFCIIQATDATRDCRRRSKSSAYRDKDVMQTPILGTIDAQDIPDSVIDDKESNLTWRLTSQKSMCPPWPAPDESAVMSKLDDERQADTFSEDNTLNVLVHLVANSLYANMVCICLSSSPTSEASFQASVGLHSLHASPVDLCELVWREGRTCILHDTQADPKCPPTLLMHGIRYYAATPVRVSGAVVGAVVAMDIVSHNQTSLAQRNTLESVARIAAEVVEERTRVNNPEVLSSAEDEEDDVVGNLESMPCIPDTMLTASARSNLMLLAVSRQSVTAYDHGIQSAMMFYRALLRSAWELEEEDEYGARLFSFEERYGRGYLKATKVIAIDGKVDWNKVLDLRQNKVYGDVVLSVTGRKMINLHTTLDHVCFRGKTLWRSTKETRLLCHRRQYPGGAWTMIAIDATDMEFCLAWLISPHAVDHVLVTLIVPHVVGQRALLFDLLSRVQEVTENMGDMRLSACSGSADILETRAVRAYSCSVLPQESSGSGFWDLLGKTILTQQLLSQQQNSMLETLEENAAKLEELSHAVDRVETLLDRHV